MLLGGVRGTRGTQCNVSHKDVTDWYPDARPKTPGMMDVMLLLARLMDVMADGRLHGTSVSCRLEQSRYGPVCVQRAAACASHWSVCM